MTDLLPCPFCGCDAEFETTTEPDGECNCVGCPDCLFSLMSGPVGIGWFGTREEAASAWNRRAQPDHFVDADKKVAAGDADHSPEAGKLVVGDAVRYNREWIASMLDMLEAMLLPKYKWSKGQVAEQAKLLREAALAAPVQPVAGGAIACWRYVGPEGDVGQWWDIESEPAGSTYMKQMQAEGCRIEYAYHGAVQPVVDEVCVAIYDAVTGANFTRDVKTDEKKIATVRSVLTAQPGEVK